jgi:hypothetical protein
VLYELKVQSIKQKDVKQLEKEKFPYMLDIYPTCSTSEQLVYSTPFKTDRRANL